MIGHGMAISSCAISYKAAPEGDIAAITEFLRQRKARAEDFVIFAGSVIVPTADLQRQVPFIGGMGKEARE